MRERRGGEEGQRNGACGCAPGRGDSFSVSIRFSVLRLAGSIGLCGVFIQLGPSDRAAQCT